LSGSDFQLASILSHPFEENTYIAHLQGRADCIVVDPGLEPEKILEHLDRHGLVPAVILNTHGHSDHIAGNWALKERWPDVPLVIGRNDAPKLTDPELNLSAGYGFSLTSPLADRVVDEGDVCEEAGFRLAVLEIPGHSVGHVVFVDHDRSPAIVYGGDVLFAGSIGRTDFPDGDTGALIHGIRSKLFALPEETVVLPGHGPPTTIGREKKSNPYVGAAPG
jgi:glyoxylase-like metal-dependent hydrolase (beta-lactamase superfamily II)